MAFRRQIRSVLVMGLSLIISIAAEPNAIDAATLKHIANVSYAAESSNGLASVFSPRMDFDQWKPLTGRGDPLRNDPTYDYEPPVLERVHYWADDTRLEREHYPEKKSEVLMLGITSRKPSVSTRQPAPPRRHHRPPPPKYEDYTYKINNHFPMTILVPPPLPPPGHKPSLFIIDDKQMMPTNYPLKLPDSTKYVKHTTAAPEKLTTYAVQESNLIFQSSSTNLNWIFEEKPTQSLPNSTVSSDYAGWGPTTPITDIETANDTHNFIFNDNTEFLKQPYSFYKPMLSEAPPPPQITQNPLLLPTFIPTALPPPLSSTAAHIRTTMSTERPTTEGTTTTFDLSEDITERTTKYFPTTSNDFSKPPTKIMLDMISPMMTMPLVNGPDRPEDNLYAHASENLHIYKDHVTEDDVNLETMQTMQPPPVISNLETTVSDFKPHHSNMNSHSLLQKKPVMYTHDPYLHMRYTSPMPTISSAVPISENSKSTTETPAVPMYLIIQGHSKVKTYSSKPNSVDIKDTIYNEIPKANETNEVKHLHPLKDKLSLKLNKESVKRQGRVQNLKSLLDEGRGSIEIQETNVGIKYDVSDGSDVPVEIYRKGIVDNDENDYSKSKKGNRVKRQIGLDDILPFDEEKFEEYVYNFLKGRRNETGITGLIAQAVTGSAGALLDDLDDDDDEQR